MVNCPAVSLSTVLGSVELSLQAKNKNDNIRTNGLIKFPLTVQVGEVRIIVFRPARHTEADYLINVQVIVFADSILSAGTIAKQRTKS